MANRLAEFRALRDRGALCTEVTEQLASEAASEFLSQHREHGGYLRDAITLLTEIATLEEPCLSQPGTRATFPFLVERLSDSFDPKYCDLYDRVFAQMITECRRLPAAADLDAVLREFGLASESALLDRKARLQRQPAMLDAKQRERVGKVLVLSRVTLGADVAITSVVLEKARQAFPGAERVLLGGAKLCELFGGDASLRIREARYETGGGLLDRLRNWPPLVESIDDEIGRLGPEEMVLVDPDSRLLQLGMLPALRDETRYFFFESRRHGHGTSRSLSELTMRWLNEQFGDGQPVLPNLNLRASDRSFAREVCGKLRREGSRRLIAVSFGVGGNSGKRLADPFEQELLRELLQDGCTVLLDKGAGRQEVERADRLADQIRAFGKVVELDPEGASAPVQELSRCLLLTWRGGIGVFSALTAESDEYIGYDSAGQHIAAALNVPTISIFSRVAPEIFRSRWRTTGKGVSKQVSELDADGAVRPRAAVVAEVMQLHRNILCR